MPGLEISFSCRGLNCTTPMEAMLNKRGIHILPRMSFPFALCRRIKELCSARTSKQLVWTCVWWWWWLHMCGEGHCICECVYVCAIMHACVYGSQGRTSAFLLFILLRQVFWLNMELTDRGVFLSLPLKFWACKSLKLHLILYLGTRTGSHACTSSLPRGPSP